MEKIQRAIAKAFLSVGSFATQDVITNILSRVSVTDGISVEEIQNQVEVALMAERYYTVAKAYMLYRQRHTEDREVRDKLQFLMEYCDASTPRQEASSTPMPTWRTRTWLRSSASCPNRISSV